MQSYRINIDKEVLRLLGAQLYGDSRALFLNLSRMPTMRMQNLYGLRLTRPIPVR